MARQIIINIDDDDWREQDIASEITEVARAIEEYASINLPKDEIISVLDDITEEDF